MIIKKGKDIDDNELSNYCVTFTERSFWGETDYVEVMSVIEKAIELSPTNAKAYFVWGRAIERRNTTDKENIKNLYAKAIELDNTNYKFYSQFAQYEDKNGNKQEAIKLYQKAMDLYGYDARTCENLGVNYAENGQLEKGLELLRRAVRYRSSSAGSKLKALTIDKLTRPVQGATQEELEKYYLEKEISNLIADAEYEASVSKWPAARYYFHIAKQKLEKEEKIIGGRLDRLLTDVYARIGWCTPAPEGIDWAQKALSKDPIHLGAIHTLAAHNLATNPEKTNELYTKIRELNPYHIAANVQFLATTFKNKDYTEVINVGTNMVQIIEKEYDVLTVEKKSVRIILKQWSDARWYLAKSFEETGNYVKALEFFELGHFGEDKARVKKLIAAGSNKNNEGFIGWNKMPNRYEIESMIAAYFKQFGSEEHKNTASKVRISDQNLWGLWKETKYNLEAPDEKIDSSFDGNVWKEDASWLNHIKLSNDFNWDDLNDTDVDKDDLEKVEVQTSFYVEVFFKDYISDASIYLDFSTEGREGNYYVECRKITLH